MLIHELVENAADRFGDRTALVLGDETVCYDSLRDQVRRAAAAFIDLGIQPGDRVAVYLNKRIETVVAYFAISYCGAVFVPVNSALKSAQVRHILTDCDVVCLVTSTSFVDTLRASLSTCAALRYVVVVDDRSSSLSDSAPVETACWPELLENAECLRAPVRRIDNDLAAIFYTSGSSGMPKGVVLSHRNVVAGAHCVTSYLNNTPDDVILAVLPLSFDAGFSQLTTGMLAGSAIVLLNYLAPMDVIHAVLRHKVTTVTGVPPLWNQLVRIDWPAGSTESLRLIANTGGAMPTATLSTLQSRLPQAEIFLMYGLTEAFRSTFLPPAELENRPTSIGKAVPNADVYVFDQHGKQCEPGEPGELVHRGATVALGYWNNPEKTAERFRPLPCRADGVSTSETAVWSGDTVMEDEDGFLYFLGRNDDMIKSSGYRISPSEVEEVVHATGLVVECAALGIPRHDVGQAVVVACQAETPDAPTRAALLKACQVQLPNYMVPSDVVWKRALPKNPNGKIDRRALAAELVDLFEASE